jgi:hypothetical protein
VPSSREYARRSPNTKFDAGHGGTFSGEPRRQSRPAAISHDSTEFELPASCTVASRGVIARFYGITIANLSWKMLRATADA